MNQQKLHEKIEQAARENATHLDLRFDRDSIRSQFQNIPLIGRWVDHPLSSLPPEIGQLVNLQELSLSFNQLSSLPPEIVRWGVIIPLIWMSIFLA